VAGASVFIQESPEGGWDEMNPHGNPTTSGNEARNFRVRLPHIWSCRKRLHDLKEIEHAKMENNENKHRNEYGQVFAFCKDLLKH